MRSEEEWKKIFRSQGITARKYMGDDSCIWAVFKRGRPVVTGLTKGEVNYHKQKIAEIEL